MEFKFKNGLHYSYDLKNAHFQIDVLQEEMLNFYLMNDSSFRKAFQKDFTSLFWQYIYDKTKLNEPIHLSLQGFVRSSKSFSCISICSVHQAFYSRDFDVEYICGNSQEFLEKLKKFPKEKLMNRMFQIDEDKSAMYGYGSIARKQKFLDVQNIIAINNISTASLCPTQFSNDKTSYYGLRAFGRDFTQKINRFMLYFLQGGGEGKLKPMGCIYIPPFDFFLEKKKAENLKKKYLAMKNEWVDNERSGQGDILAEIRKKTAESFLRDKTIAQLTKKSEIIEYIIFKLGSEWTKSECNSVYNLYNLMRRHLIS